MLQIASLNSGSNGNCYYVGNSTDAILIDAGISCRETDKRMLSLGLSMEKVRAIFISHEHGDHIRGLEVLAKKYRMPIFITEGTRLSGKLKLDPILVYTFKHHKKIKIGDLTINPFQKHHDAADPYSFTISCKGINIGVYTDIGATCEHLKTHFKSCHAAFLEANYDVEMLETGNYPYHLKQRIRGGKGHLSNAEALELFNSHRSDSLQLLLLSHLSKNNNDPELVHALFTEHAGSTKVRVASRYEASEVFEITTDVTTQLLNQQVIVQQLSLF